MVDVAIIGSGIVGAFIARALSRFELDVLIIEKENDIANGSSIANSGIIYDGFHSKPDKLKGQLIPIGNEMYDQVCKELEVPFKRIGSLVIGSTEEDLEKITKKYQRGIKNNVPGLKIIYKDAIQKIEPTINKEIKFALYSPTCGIISPFELNIALVENAVANGTRLLLNHDVLKINKKDHGFSIITNQETIEASIVINCAGIYADEINNMVSKNTFKISPKRGQYIVLDKAKEKDKRIHSVIFQNKKEDEKGLLFVPTVDNNLLIASFLDETENKEDIGTTSDILERMKEKSNEVYHDLPFNSVIRSFSGLKAKIIDEDYIIEELSDIKGFVNVAGITTPGMTCAPSIAEMVVKIVEKITLYNNKEFKENINYNPLRKRITRLKDLTASEKIKLIQNNPKYGKIVCRCETITEGEILDAIHRNPGATTVKGVKKRTGSSMGRCQGGFCSPRILKILATELNKNMFDIVYDRKESYILKERI
jgi:glycerol-3-phosphate dehydrogenase